ncbi:hypothetical protein [Streptomyces sp. SID161]|uniref:hypothetical protein n=1 Tax=unclassified Streptomyces TaxID=2593676 RepID=UPI00136CE4E7|nr:hypothetical protein [Streptomyces sp. SID161]MYW47350.1 hypothetical protein [Streptomyces sp. SID161]
MTEQTQAERPVQETAVPAPPPLPPGPPPVAAPEKDRTVLRAALRWTAAAVVFAVAGAGTAYGITRMDRTDLPGLATASDGRWDYPELVRPPVPAGSPGPLADANRSGTHYADLRALVLPAPRGAETDPALRGTDGWLATKDFLAQYPDAYDRRDLGRRLTDHGLRHIAARGWTAADGTRTRIQLLQFDTAAVADEVMDTGLADSAVPTYKVRGADDSILDDTFPERARIDGIRLVPYTEAEPYGAEQVRQAYLAAGDTVAVITLSRAGGVGAVPFRQTVTLQSELLA